MLFNSKYHLNQDDNYIQRYRKVNMWAQDAMIYSLSFGIGCVLVIMGTKTSVTDLRDTFVKKKAKIFFIVAQHYITAPIYAIGLVKILELDTPRALGLLISSVTPPTVAASVTTFMVEGDVPLSVTASVTTLVSSFICMPMVFTGQVYIIDRNDVSLKIPYGQMCGILIYMVVLKGFGMTLKKYYEDKLETLEKINKLLKRCAVLSMVFALGFLVSSKKLLNSSFYAGPGWYKHYSSCILFIVGTGIISHISYTALNNKICVNMQTNTKERDAMLLTTIRKNPAIALSVTAISFKDYLNDEDYSSAFGLVFVNAMLLDWCTFPFVALLRKLRLGYVFKESQSQQSPEPQSLPDSFTEIVITTDKQESK